jgi:hypothetical protein
MSRDRNAISGRLIGGLGNQLFIWAATNYYANQFNKTPRFDFCGKQKLELSLILEDDIESNHISNFKRFMTELIIRVSRLNHFASRSVNLFFGIYSQAEVGFDENREPDKNSSYIFGYFQSARFVKNLSNPQLRDKFNLKLETDIAKQAKDKLHNDGGIAIHIRLGDYLNEQNQYFGILAPSYYVNSLNALGVLPGTTVWVFTDSSEIAKSIYSRTLEAQFKLLWASDRFELSAIEEFKLLTNVRKLVIANSTFSWWAAMIAGENCQTIFPSKWFKSANDPVGLKPEQWEIVESVWLERKIKQ